MDEQPSVVIEYEDDVSRPEAPSVSPGSGNSAPAVVLVLLLVGSLIGALFLLDRAGENASQSPDPPDLRLVLGELSADQIELRPVGEGLSASGDSSPQIDRGFARTVAVGSQPTTSTRPIPVLVDFLSAHGAAEFAESTCSLEAVEGESRGTYDLIDCGGERTGRIAGREGIEAFALATVSTVLEIENLITVQPDGSALSEVVLGQGKEVVSIAATPDGFLAVVLDTLDGLDPERRRLGDPTGRLYRWTVDTGLVDITSTLPNELGLSDWFNMEVVVDANGIASVATDDEIYRGDAEYRAWELVRQAPVETLPGTTVLRIGPQASAMVFADSEGRVWVGRVDQGWFRVASLDGMTPAEVLLSDDKRLVVAFNLTLEPELVSFELLVD